MPVARVTIIQFEREHKDPHRNLERMALDVRAHASSDLVVFPELALHGHDRVTEGSDPSLVSSRATAEMEEELDALAASCGTSIIYGACLPGAGGSRNVATFTNGRERVSYAKTHVHWSEEFVPGADFPVVRAFQRPLGMLICFDAAFAEVPRLLALAGAEIVVNISAIPASFPLKHVHRRLVACSVQNQVFTIFANRAGDGFLGGSAVVDPEGEIVAVAGERGALTVDIDLDDVRRWREAEPLLAHRRPHMYQDIAR